MGGTLEGGFRITGSPFITQVEQAGLSGKHLLNFLQIAMPSNDKFADLVDGRWWVRRHKNKALSDFDDALL
jgi:hypothetical protein